MKSPLQLETSRLQLRWLQADDAAFILRLVNDSDWLRFIGDKQVGDLEDARNYLESGPMAMYLAHGFGLNRVALKTRGNIPDTAIGICGLLQRDTMKDCDLGFALLPEFRGHGYACEAAQAILQYGFQDLGKTRIAALVNIDNRASIQLLEKLGFQREGRSTEPNQDSVDLYIIEPPD